MVVAAGGFAGGWFGARRVGIFAVALAAACDVVMAEGFRLPPEVRQCVVGIADSWDASRAVVSVYEKSGGGWRQRAGPWPARLGRRGLAWGLGLHPLGEGQPMKREGDSKAPAGVFRLGGAWGYEPEVARHPSLAYARVGPRDLWIEDPSSPLYNTHLRLDRDPSTPWELKQRMKQNDPAHALKLFIAHNAGPRIVPGAGSAIFFHIWRAGGSKASSGCTTLAEEHLRELIATINPTMRPVYVLLPRAEYFAVRERWGLP